MAVLGFSLISNKLKSVFCCSSLNGAVGDKEAKGECISIRTLMWHFSVKGLAFEKRHRSVNIRPRQKSQSTNGIQIIAHRIPSLVIPVYLQN